MENLTIISHIFNEEYLLPFWLEHHKQHFDHGIIIDYYSTDRSVEIINKICPTWSVIKTKNINEDGSPNFDARMVDAEINEIERTINGYKICLNTTEFLMTDKSKDDFINSLSKNLYYHIKSHSIMTTKKNNYPRNTIEFFEDIELLKTTIEFSGDINLLNKLYYRGHRILHSNPDCIYATGRHARQGNSEENVYITNVFILWAGLYPTNHKIIERKLQIQNNIPQTDKNWGLGIQHMIDKKMLIERYDTEMQCHKSIHEYNMHVKNVIKYTCDNLRKNNIYYSELLVDSNWGEDKCMLDNDINLLSKTDFDNSGYKILDIENCNHLMQIFIKNEIKFITGKDIDLKNYHNEINEDEHKIILNSMPYKKDMYPDVKEFCEYIENLISNELNEPIKIFNDDLWFRICRPSKICDNDYNPCHRDVYLDFYRNIVNIYLPVVGSNEKSALTLHAGSHKWKENETMVTNGGAHFKHVNKKYSVDAIVASKQPLDMIRPNPNENQLMLFSPYLIHGCANNENEDITRISLEVRFIRNDENGRKQEAEFNEFLKIRNWR